MSAVELRGLTVDFPSRGVRALDAVDLEFAAGEHVALLGPSGAGKTTLLRALLGGVAPAAGSVRVGGRDPFGSRADRRALRTSTGFVPQGGDLVLAASARLNALSATAPCWTAADWARVVRGRVPARFARRLNALAARHGVADCLEARAAELSGGQRRRVALLRALLPGPELLLADEPTAGLDPPAAARALEAIRKAALTVIVSTHDLTIAAAFPRIVALRQGRVAHDGPAVDLAAIYGGAP